MKRHPAEILLINCCCCCCCYYYYYYYYYYHLCSLSTVHSYDLYHIHRHCDTSCANRLNSHLTCFQWGFIAQLVGVMGSNPVGASEFFLGFISNCLSYFTTAKRPLSLLFTLDSSEPAQSVYHSFSCNKQKGFCYYFARTGINTWYILSVYIRNISFVNSKNGHY